MHTTNIPARPEGRRAQPASAGWSPWFEQSSYLSMSPEQFFDIGVNIGNVCPETALLYAVLEDAFLCYQKQFEAGVSPIRMEAAREAEEWFFSDRSRELFSFVSVCAALGLEPEFIRKRLRHWS
jgi:hypothetical protein